MVLSLTGGLGYSYNVVNTLPLTQTNLANYPVTAGTEALRHAIASWLERRYQLPALDLISS